MKLIIAGGSGFLGQVLARHFQSQFNDIVILSRNAVVSKTNIRTVAWDGRSLGSWASELNGCNVLINLTGKNVNCRYTEKNKVEILNSRLQSTHILAEAIRQASQPPAIWIQAASSTIYNHSFQPNDESSNNMGDDFSMTVCKEWERAFWEEDIQTRACFKNTDVMSNESETSLSPVIQSGISRSSLPRNDGSTKKILMRVAIVLGKHGGAWPTLKRLTQFGLGGKQGKGNQMISWIHEHDFAHVVEWLIRNGQKNGVYNVCSPNVVPNHEFMRIAKRSLNVLIGIPSPAWLLNLGSKLIGTETELVLKSRFVSPKNLLSEGFQFEYSDLQKALTSLSR